MQWWFDKWLALSGGELGMHINFQKRFDFSCVWVFFLFVLCFVFFFF